MALLYASPQRQPHQKLGQSTFSHRSATKTSLALANSATTASTSTALLTTTFPILHSSQSLNRLPSFPPARPQRKDSSTPLHLRRSSSGPMNVQGEHAQAIPPAMPPMIHGRPVPATAAARRVSNAVPISPSQPVENGTANPPVDAPMQPAVPAGPQNQVPPPPAAAQPPVGPQQMMPHALPSMGQMQPPQFDGGRSPPGSKNLSHVPCKFFKVGTCQAGKACPFSHSMDMSNDAPCKYFQKGNCKFGQKCALAHILPDGRRINRPNYNAGGHLQIGGRINPEHFPNQRSALHNSLLQANLLHQHQPPHQPPHAFNNGDEFPTLGNPQPTESAISAAFASPRDENLLSSSLAASHRTLGPLDATLPASLDSNTLSHFARHGPFAASVPSKFGLDSPPISIPSERTGALRSLYISAFGEEESSVAGSPSLARSPPVTEEGFGMKILHSSKRAYLRAGLLSSSFPVAMSGWPEQQPDDLDDDLDNPVFEEDYIPGSLQDLLTDKERQRRFSRTEEDGIGRRSIAGSFADSHQPPIGSPPASSRFGPLFVRKPREEDTISGIGHVGSPLRNSHLNDDSPINKSANRASADFSFVGSPGSGRPSGLSALSAQLSRTMISTEGLDPVSTASSPLAGQGKKPETPTIGNSKLASIDDDTQFAMD